MHLTKDSRSTKSPVQQAARAMSSTVFGFLSLLQLPRNSSVPPLHQHRKREAVCMVSNNKDEKIRANHRESGNVSLMRKNLQLMEQNSSFLLLIWKFQFLLSLKIYLKKITTPFISMLLKLLFKMLTHTQGVPAPSAQRGKHLIN